MKIFSTALLVCSVFVVLFFFSMNNNKVNATFDKLQEMLSDYESSITTLATKIGQAEATRCSRLQNWANSPDACSYPACGSDFPTAENEFTCNGQFGVSSPTCGDCSALVRSLNKSTVLLAPDTDFATDSTTQGFFTLSSDVENAMLNEFKNGVGYRKNNGGWQGYGSEFAYRFFPGAPRSRNSQECTAYDARSREWFRVALSGPKSVQIVIDASESLNYADCSNVQAGKRCVTKFDLAKESAIAILDYGLTKFDRFSVIGFHSSAFNVYSSGLQSGSDSNIAAAKSAIRNMRATGTTTVYSTGLEVAFNNIRNNDNLCDHHMIVLISDGVAYDSSTINGFITTQKNSITDDAISKGVFKNITVHTVVTNDGKTASTTTARSIACANGGISFDVKSSTDVENTRTIAIRALSSFFKFLAHFTNSSGFTWSDRFYSDSVGNLQAVATLSKQVWDTSDPSHPIFSGVAAVDIKNVEFTQFVISSVAISELSKRASNSSQCFPSDEVSLSDCQLQTLRKIAGHECPAPAPAVATCRSSQNPICDAFVNGGVNSMLCSSLDQNTMLAANVGSRKTTGQVECCEGCANYQQSAGAGSLVTGMMMVISLFVLIIVF